jgi:hypothetical protein
MGERAWPRTGVDGVRLSDSEVEAKLREFAGIPDCKTPCTVVSLRKAYPLIRAKVNLELHGGVRKKGTKKRQPMPKEFDSVVDWGFGLPKLPEAPGGELHGKVASKAWAIRPGDKRRR